MKLNLLELVNLLKTLLESYKTLENTEIAKQFDKVFNTTIKFFDLSRAELYKIILSNHNDF